MDNVCHTLVGAALAESGLGRRTSLGFATLLIGANLPDLDILSYFDGPLAAYEWRRGWSHGIIAIAVLPLLLAAAMIAVDRVSRRLRRAVLPTEVRAGAVLLLAFLAVLTHPILDTLNTYGVRWMLPLTNEWTYGDTLYIVDPWVWLVLGAGVWSSRKRRHARERNVIPELPARRALLLTLAYVTIMAASGALAGRIAVQEMTAGSPGPIASVMPGPVALDPFARDIVLVRGETYATARFRWLAKPHVDPGTVRTYPTARPAHAAVAAAAATVSGRRFLGWARFPHFSVDSAGAAYLVHIVDLRYTDQADAGFGAVTIPVSR